MAEKKTCERGFSGCDACPCRGLTKCECVCHKPIEFAQYGFSTRAEFEAHLEEARQSPPNPNACPSCNTRLRQAFRGIDATHCFVCGINYDHKTRQRIIRHDPYHDPKTGECNHTTMWPRDRSCPNMKANPTSSQFFWKVRDGDKVCITDGEYKDYHGIVLGYAGSVVGVRLSFKNVVWIHPVHLNVLTQETTEKSAKKRKVDDAKDKDKDEDEEHENEGDEPEDSDGDEKEKDTKKKTLKQKYIEVLEANRWLRDELSRANKCIATLENLVSMIQRR